MSLCKSDQLAHQILISSDILDFKKFCSVTSANNSCLISFDFKLCEIWSPYQVSRGVLSNHRHLWTAQIIPTNQQQTKTENFSGNNVDRQTIARNTDPGFENGRNDGRWGNFYLSGYKTYSWCYPPLHRFSQRWKNSHRRWPWCYSSDVTQQFTLMLITFILIPII